MADDSVEPSLSTNSSSTNRESFTIEDIDQYGLEEFYHAMRSLKLSHWNKDASCWEVKDLQPHYGNQPN
jgi:hypothetical protein